MKIFENIVCLCFGLSFLFEKMVARIFLSRLRKLHTATWRQLGEPATMMLTFKLYGYLWRRDFNLLPDEKIAVIGRSFRLFWLCRTTLLLLMVVIGLFEAVRIFSEFGHR